MFKGLTDGFDQIVMLRVIIQQALMADLLADLVARGLLPGPGLRRRLPGRAGRQYERLATF